MDLLQFLAGLSPIQYGWWHDGKKKAITFKDPEFDQEELFAKYCRIQRPDEVREHKCGTCWDLTLLIFSALNGLRYQKETYRLPCTDVQTFYFEQLIGKNKEFSTHTATLFKETHSGKYFWFEYSWFIHRGIHGPYDSKDQFFRIFENDFIKACGGKMTMLNKSFDAEALLKLETITAEDFIAVAREPFK